MRFIKYITLANFIIAFLFAFGIGSDISAQTPGTNTRTAGSHGERPQRQEYPNINNDEQDPFDLIPKKNKAEQARIMRETRLREASREIEKNPRITEQLKMSAIDLRIEYKTALAANPNLKFGQFVAANMIAQNLGSTNSKITVDAILLRLSKGNSVGEALRDLGLSKEEAKQAEAEAKRQLSN